MTRVLVTGASGFIGTALCPVLNRAGFHVSVATRNPRRFDRVPGVDVRPIAGLGAGTDWTGALRDVDHVVHLAARVHVMEETESDPQKIYTRVNLEGTRRLAEDAAAMGVERFVFLSTVKVMGERTEPDAPFTEAMKPAPADPYAISKWQAERALMALGARAGTTLQPVVLRPPLVYGPGVKGNMERLFRACAKGRPLPLGLIRNRRSLVGVGNLASAIVAALDHPAAAGGTYLVRDGEDLSSGELARRVYRALGRRPRVWLVPPALLRLGGNLLGREAAVARLLDSLQVDDGKLRRDLGWTPPVGIDDELAATARAFTGLPVIKGAPAP
ncbi:MAG: NAD-dependent epimerase/dehydratase family protein [Rhodobacterales bacterium]|nr:NAD-dependent epimerase/dehydratase family protein [Rhodobacterales bacterium]